jgi:uncharacterized membrane protein
MSSLLWPIVLVNIANVFGAAGGLLIKKATNKMAFTLSSILFNRQLFIGIALYFIGTVLFVPALKFGELSVLYPFVAITYIWTILFSIKFLNEKMNAFKWIGALLIICGISIIGLGSV